MIIRGFLSVMVALAATGAVAEDDPHRRFDGFARTIGPVCALDASTRCFDVGWAYVDRDDDAFLDLGELTHVQEEVRGWTQSRWQQLSVAERSGLSLGLWTLDTVGLESLFASYDANRDDRLSRDELLADVTIDERRLIDVIRDRDAIDWQTLASRFGPLSGLLGALKPPGG
ncbi:MAG: hypothetical protein ACFB6S_10150 [Geminicoccaceae bacterium]